MNNSGMNSFYIGVVESRHGDPFKIGRCKVRVFGIHTEDKTELPTKDLPWAYPLSQITSASISGIGIAATGLLNGSWVLITFLDEYKQKPIILGSLGGVPVSEPSKFVPTQFDAPPHLVDSEMIPIVNPSPDNPSTPDGESTTPNIPSTPGKVNDPKQMKISEAGKAFIKNHEALSSLEKGRNVPTRNWASLPDSTPIYSYRDTKGLWTIGYGNRFLLNGTEVNADTVLTKAECESLFEGKLEQEFESGVRNKLSVQVTQEMYDALISMAWNMGVGGLTSSQMFSALNSGKYDVAAALIPSTRNNNGTLSGRRAEEKKLFSSGGFPSSDGRGVSEFPEQKLEKAEQEAGQLSNNNSGGGASPNPSTSQQTQSDNIGFVDPDNVYPRDVDEQDSDRLSRRESESDTILKIKESARMVGVKTSGTKPWTQPKIPYVASYPYNNVRISESGHVIEIDDTKDAERLHWYHRAGTYTEIDANGTVVNRIVGDDFSILERSGHVYIKGNLQVNIEGNANVTVESDLNLSVKGNLVAKIGGDMALEIGGNMTHSVGGFYQLNVGTDYFATVNGQASISANENVFAAKGDSTLNAGGVNSINGERINLNSGTGSLPKISVPTPREPRKDKELPPLVNLFRYSELYGAVDTPEDGDPSEFNAQKAKIFDPEEKVPTIPSEKDKITVANKSPAPGKTISCDKLEDSDITPGYKLSELFTLGDLLARGKSGYPKGLNYGKTSSEIICNLKAITINCLDLIKAAYPNMIITSTWRSEEYNNTLRGASKTSDHLSGCAADLQFNGFDRKQYIQAAAAIQKMLPSYNQIILEYRGSSMWLHVSYKQTGNKMQCLTLDATSNKILKSDGFC